MPNTWNKSNEFFPVEISMEEIDAVSGGEQRWDRKGFFRELRECFSKKSYSFHIDNVETMEGHWVWGGGRP